MALCIKIFWKQSVARDMPAYQHPRVRNDTTHEYPGKEGSCSCNALAGVTPLIVVTMHRHGVTSPANEQHSHEVYVGMDATACDTPLGHASNSAMRGVGNVVAANPCRLCWHAPAMPPRNRKVGSSYAVLISPSYTEGACCWLIQYPHEPPRAGLGCVCDTHTHTRTHTHTHTHTHTDALKVGSPA